MSTRQHLRIYSFQKNELANKLAGYAAMFNGGHNQYGLIGLATIGNGDLLQYPSLYEGLQIHSFPTSLTVDKTEKSGETVCVMAIELVELADLKTIENEID